MDILSLIIRELRDYENKGRITYFVPVTKKYLYYTIVDETSITEDMPHVESKYIIRLLNNIIKIMKRYTLNPTIDFYECINNLILSVGFQLGSHYVEMNIGSIYNRAYVAFVSGKSSNTFSLMSLSNEDVLMDILERITK